MAKAIIITLLASPVVLMAVVARRMVNSTHDQIKRSEDLRDSARQDSADTQ